MSGPATRAAGSTAGDGLVAAPKVEVHEAARIERVVDDAMRRSPGLFLLLCYDHVGTAPDCSWNSAVQVTEPSWARVRL